MTKRPLVLSTFLLITQFVISPAMGQATRTWVSGTGDDNNPCSRTAPCKTFAGAISKTAAGGEIDNIDPGGYGSVTITKSISIVGTPGAGILTSGAAKGIVVQAGASDVVYLDGLVLDGNASSAVGVQVTSAAMVYIRNCTIKGYLGAPGVAISVEPTSNAQVIVSNCAIVNNNVGILAKAPTASTEVLLDGVTITRSAGPAVQADGANATVRLRSSAITANAKGVDPINGGTVASFGNNAIVANAVDGTPTPIPLR